ncbi:hypothetical protein MRB53_039536 [Persea americana]|nr:hypothetical protein MRB53_039536 [Persea americana]
MFRRVREDDRTSRDAVIVPARTRCPQHESRRGPRQATMIIRTGKLDDRSYNAVSSVGPCTNTSEGASLGPSRPRASMCIAFP